MEEEEEDRDRGDRQETELGSRLFCGRSWPLLLLSSSSSSSSSCSETVCVCWSLEDLLRLVLPPFFFSPSSSRLKGLTSGVLVSTDCPSGRGEISRCISNNPIGEGVGR